MSLPIFPSRPLPPHPPRHSPCRRSFCCNPPKTRRPGNTRARHSSKPPHQSRGSLWPGLSSGGLGAPSGARRGPSPSPAAHQGQGMPYYQVHAAHEVRPHIFLCQTPGLRVLTGGGFIRALAAACPPPPFDCGFFTSKRSISAAHELGSVVVVSSSSCFWTALINLMASFHIREPYIKSHRDIPPS